MVLPLNEVRQNHKGEIIPKRYREKPISDCEDCGATIYGTSYKQCVNCYHARRNARNAAQAPALVVTAPAPNGFYYPDRTQWKGLYKGYWERKDGRARCYKPPGRSQWIAEIRVSHTAEWQRVSDHIGMCWQAQKDCDATLQTLHTPA